MVGHLCLSSCSFKGVCCVCSFLCVFMLVPYCACRYVCVCLCVSVWVFVSVLVVVFVFVFVVLWCFAFVCVLAGTICL